MASDRKLSEFVKVIRGISYRSTDYASKGEGVTFINLKCVGRNGGFRHDGIKYYKGQIRPEQIVLPGDILIANTDLTQNREIIGSPLIVPDLEQPICFSLDLTKLELTGSDLDKEYLFYFLKSSYARGYMVNHSNGSTVVHLSVASVPEMPIDFPEKDQQLKIAKTLGDLDRKIELNQRMNETLELMGKALFKKYFIDNPDRDQWNIRTLGEFFPIRTGKKDANFSTADGLYPFFTCSQNNLRAPGYSFDGPALLMAGNGDFSIKYYRGKFEAYQRTYVLMPHNESFLGLLYFLVSIYLGEITGGSRGSVIKFITKGMIEDFKIKLPDDDQISEVAKHFSDITISIEKNTAQSQTLMRARDALLSKIMDGSIAI